MLTELFPTRFLLARLTTRKIKPNGLPTANTQRPTLALSLFWVIDALMVSIWAVVSSTLAACSLAACETDWLDEETWAAVPANCWEF